MNFSFQFVCSKQIKMYQESGLLGAFFGTVYCRIAGASGGFAPGPPPGLCPGPTGGAYSTPQTTSYSRQWNTVIACEIRSLLLAGTTFIHALMTNLAHHSKFLKKGLGNTYSRYFIMQINYQLNVWEETFYLPILPHSWKLDFIGSFSYFRLKEF